MTLAGDERSLVATPYEADQNVHRLGGETTVPSDQHLVLAARSG